MTTLTKPFDLAYSAVLKAADEAKATRKPVSFFFRHLYCCVFTTPSGQVRYQVSPCGKPSRSATAMLDELTRVEQEAQDFAARGTRVPMTADVNYCEGHAPTVLLKGRVLLSLPTNHGYSLYFHVGAMPRGQEGRREYAGPMVPGPWAFANQRATVISASAAFREKDAAEEAAAIPVQDGSLLVIDNCQYRVEVVRGEWLTLHLVTDYSAK